MRGDVGLVVLSGCSSAGEALPAEGLMGLTRAWLAGGARAVIATQWPTPDDSGELFRSFYGALRALPGSGSYAVRAALALQQAQREMLRSGSWRSDPRYWAAYFVLGKDV